LHGPDVEMHRVIHWAGVLQRPFLDGPGTGGDIHPGRVKDRTVDRKVHHARTTGRLGCSGVVAHAHTATHTHGHAKGQLTFGRDSLGAYSPRCGRVANSIQRLDWGATDLKGS